MGRNPHNQAAAGIVAEKEVDTMNEFFTVKALLNAWHQLNLEVCHSSSDTAILSASRFASTDCAYVHFSYLPESEFFYVSYTYYEGGKRFEKEYQTANLHRAIKAAYRYSEELNTL